MSPPPKKLRVGRKLEHFALTNKSPNNNKKPNNLHSSRT